MRAPASTSVAPLAIAIASVARQHVGEARRDQDQVGEAHHLHRPRRRADVAGMAGADEDEAGGVAGHAAAKIVSHDSRSAARMRARALSSVTPPHRRKPTRSHVPSAAPHAQHRHQGGPRRRGDHQPRLARPRPAAGRTPRRRTTSSPRSTTPPRRRSSRRCSPRIRATASSPRSRARAHGARDSEYVWIIDPLDGTTNFIHGLPIYAVSIALALSRPDPAGGRLRPGAQRPVLRLEGPRRLPQRQAAARLEAHAHGRRADRHRLSVSQGRRLRSATCRSSRR